VADPDRAELGLATEAGPGLDQMQQSGELEGYRDLSAHKGRPS
jgi:hypothetical protein